MRKPFAILLWLIGILPLAATAQIQEKDSLPQTTPIDSAQVVLADTTVQATPVNDPSEVKPNLAYLKGYITDTKAVIRAPLHWKTRDWLKASGIVAGAVAIYPFDQRIKDWSQRARTNNSAHLVQWFEPLGNGRYLMITSGLVFLHGQLFKNSRTTRTGLLILESQLINGVLGQVMKFSASRKRPRDGGVYNEFQGPNTNPASSFPSGHAQTVFALMTMIASEFKDVKVVPPLAYTIATITSLSRIHDNAHWSSDVWVGMALGFFITKAIYRQHIRPGGSRIGLIPVSNHGKTGLGVSYKF